MKRRGIIVRAAALVLGSATFASAQGIEDSCRDVLLYSARNSSVETYDLGVAKKVYDQYCENDSVKSGSNLDIGAAAVIKGVPAKFRLGSGSSEERAKFFCKTFDSDYKRNETRYTQIEQVVNETTNAWLACKMLAGQGVLFRPKILATQVIIEVARTNAAPTSVQGITYDPALLSCTVPNTDTAPKRVTADKDTTKALKDDSFWPVTCIRKPQQQQNETIYPKVDISVDTTRGTFPLPVPAEAKFPYQWASELQNGMKVQGDRLNETAKRVVDASAKIEKVVKPEETFCQWRDYTSKFDPETTFVCKLGEYVNGVGFKHTGGQNLTFQESVRVRCCNLAP